MKNLTLLLLFLITTTASAQWSDNIDTVTTGNFNDINPQVDHAGMVPGLINGGGYPSLPNTEWIAFERWNGSADAISAGELSASSLKWDTSVVTISPETSGTTQKYPDICTIGSGVSVAAWQERSGGSWNIYASIHNTGIATWTAPVALTNDTMGNTNVKVRPLSDSSMILIWKSDKTILCTVFKSGGFSGIDTLVTSNTDSTEYDYAGNEFAWLDTTSTGNRLCLVSAVQVKDGFSLSPADTIAADGDISNPRFMIFYGQAGYGLTFNVYKNGRYSAWEASSLLKNGWSIGQSAGSATASYLNGIFYVPMQLTSAEPGLHKIDQAYFGGVSACEKISDSDTSVVFFQAVSDSNQQGKNPSITSLTYSAGNKTYFGFAVWQSYRTGRFHIYARSFLWKLDAINQLPGQPTTYRLDQNYPNPFNPSTVIGFVVRSSGFVSLKVYDVLGREVATLVAGRQSPGAHSVVFNGSKFASGVYFYRLTAPGVNIVRKMLLEK